jgi:UDP-glucose 4-epimerase
MPNPAETILITGAGGFVGGTIVEALHFAGDYRVHAGIARWSSAPRIARLPIKLVQCDVMKPEELSDAFVDVDYIIHCAVGDDLSIMVEGTKNVLRAAANAGVKRVVYISSVAVYGEATGDIDEGRKPPPGTLSGYGAAKTAAEALCIDLGRDLDVVILRPSIIYGPFSARWTMLYALRLKSGRWTVRDERSCAVLFATLNVTDRPHHRIVIEYDYIEIVRVEHCVEVLGVSASSEPRSNER